MEKAFKAAYHGIGKTLHKQMGIDIRLIDESGKEISNILDPEGLTKNLIPDLASMNSPCLKFIDLYGDTVFNKIQMPFLISELEILLAAIQDKKLNSHVMAILKLADKVQEEVHLYLKFCGD